MLKRWWVPINNLQLEPYSIRQLGLDDLQTIADLETRTNDYSLFMTGFLPSLENAKDLFEPEGVHVFGVFLEQSLIGILQIITFQLENEIIGLMLLDPEHRRMKLGTRVFQAYRNWVESRGIAKTTIFVSLENQNAIEFWLVQGFVFTSSNAEAVTFGKKTHVMQELEFEF